jgi:hypothetical protein
MEERTRERERRERERECERERERDVGSTGNRSSASNIFNAASS